MKVIVAPNADAASAPCTGGAGVGLRALRHVHGQLDDQTERMTDDARPRTDRDPSSTFAASTFVALVAPRRGAARRARAQDADPFAGERRRAVPHAERRAPPSQQAPASAPAARRPPTSRPGIVEQLPRPPTRSRTSAGSTAARSGWTCRACSGRTTPRIGRRHLGLRLGRQQLQAARASATRAVRRTTPSCSSKAASCCGVTPTYTNGSWFVQAQAEIVANMDQLDDQPAPQVVDTDDVWVRTGVWQKLGRHGRAVRGLRRLSTWAWASTSTPTSASGAYDPVHRRPNGSARCRSSTARTTCSTGPPGPGGNVALHLYPVRVPAHRAARPVGQRRHRELSRAPRPALDLRPRLVEVPRGAPSTSTSSPRIPRRRAQEHDQEPRRRRLGPVRVRAVRRVRRQRRRRGHRRRRCAQPTAAGGTRAFGQRSELRRLRRRRAASGLLPNLLVGRGRQLRQLPQPLT